MTVARAIFVLAGVILLAFSGAYLARYFSGQQTPVANPAEPEEVDKNADLAGQLRSASGKSGRPDRMPQPSAIAESVRPNIVIYKHGKPLWELGYGQLHEHVDDLRALADAGWGQTVLPLARLVSGCHGRSAPRSEREILAHARSRRERWRKNVDDWPEDRVRRELAQIEPWLEAQLELAKLRRSACASVTNEDVARIMDWLELALEQRHPAFLAGYLRWEVLPHDDAWMVRYAERLANFNRRFEAAYLDGVYAGEWAMLDLAWRLHATRMILPDPDPFMAFAFNHAAELEARESPGMTRQYMDSYRLEAIGLDPEMVDDAYAEGERIYERCCAEARMPR